MTPPPLEPSDPLVVRLVAISMCLGTCGMVTCGTLVTSGSAWPLVLFGVIGGLGLGITLTRFIDWNKEAQ